MIRSISLDNFCAISINRSTPFSRESRPAKIICFGYFLSTSMDRDEISIAFGIWNTLYPKFV